IAATASAAARGSLAPSASASVNVASPVSRARSRNADGSSVARRATIMARRRAWSGPAAKREAGAGGGGGAGGEGGGGAAQPRQRPHRSRRRGRRDRVGGVLEKRHRPTV